MNLKRLFLCLFLVALFVLPTGAALAAENAIAIVIAAEGSCYVRRDGQADTYLQLKAPLLASDIIITGEGSKLQILFNDNSTVALGPDSFLELREFANEGAQSKFNAHLEQGAMRVITGAITEANPNGFKMTTPLATIGIRGTILNIETSDRRTLVRVLNTDKTVLVNGVIVAEDFKILINRGQEPKVERLEPGERENAVKEFTLSAKGDGRLNGSQSPPSADNMTVPQVAMGGLMNDLNEHPVNVSDPGSIIPITPPVTMATISGALVPGSNFSGTFNGNFSCDINLNTGQVTNASMNGSGSGLHDMLIGSGTYNVSMDFDLTGGSGTLSGNLYTIGNFTSGTLEGLSTTTTLPLTSDPQAFDCGFRIDAGTSNFSNIGDQVGPNSIFYVTYYNATNSTYYPLIDGSLNGGRTN